MVTIHSIRHLLYHGINTFTYLFCLQEYKFSIFVNLNVYVEAHSPNFPHSSVNYARERASPWDTSQLLPVFDAILSDLLLPVMSPLLNCPAKEPGHTNTFIFCN